MEVHLILTKEQVELIRDALFQHKIELKKERNKSSDPDERSTLDDQITTLEMEILPMLGIC